MRRHWATRWGIGISVVVAIRFVETVAARIFDVAIEYSLFEISGPMLAHWTGFAGGMFLGSWNKSSDAQPAAREG